MSAGRFLATTLWAGALYDAAVGVVLLVLPLRLAALLALAPPEPVYLRLIAVFLLILAAVYALAARDPTRQRALVAVAIAGRLAGAAVLLLESWTSGRPAFLLLGGGDLVFAVLHLAGGMGLGTRAPGAVRAP